MAYKINGVIRLADNGDANLGLVTATNIDASTGIVTASLLDGKVSEKAITEQTAGFTTDVSGSDEVIFFDKESNSLLRVSVDEFIVGAGIGTLVSDFDHIDSDSLNVTGISTISGVEFNSGIISASSPGGIVTFIGDGSQLTNLPGGGGGAPPSDSATRLATPRDIWGQSFDGTANVSGTISNATDGEFSGTVNSGALNVVGLDTTTANGISTINDIQFVTDTAGLGTDAVSISTYSCKWN